MDYILTMAREMTGSTLIVMLVYYAIGLVLAVLFAKSNYESMTEDLRGRALGARVYSGVTCALAAIISPLPVASYVAVTIKYYDHAPPIWVFVVVGALMSALLTIIVTLLITAAFDIPYIYLMGAIEKRAERRAVRVRGKGI